LAGAPDAQRRPYFIFMTRKLTIINRDPDFLGHTVGICGNRIEE
jgi:hypothetical protein